MRNKLYYFVLIPLIAYTIIRTTILLADTREFLNTPSNVLRVNTNRIQLQQMPERSLSCIERDQRFWFRTPSGYSYYYCYKGIEDIQYRDIEGYIYQDKETILRDIKDDILFKNKAVGGKIVTVSK